MKYALLGNTGLIVSRLAFGAMTFTATDGAGARVNRF
jgi:aryl-alcohol dehydrogenase-like predicted oxidoreductase